MAKMEIGGVTYEGTPGELREIVRTFEDLTDTAAVEEPSRDQPKIGDTVRLVSTGGSPTASMFGFKIGDIGVLGEGLGLGNTFRFKKENGDSGYVSAHHIEVLTSATSNTITYECEEYTKVDRKAQEGDIVEITSKQYYFTKGKTYGPVNKDLEITDDEGDKLPVYESSFGRTETSVIVYEKVASPFDKFSKGAKVRLLSGGGKYPLQGFVDGKTYEVDVNDFDHDTGRRIRLKRGGFPNQGFALPEQLELVTEETPKELTLKVGDKVEVIDGSKARYEDLSSGTIGEITDIDEDYTQPIRVDTSDDYDRFPAEALRKVEEVSKYPKVGDVVRVISGFAGIKEGDIGVVTGADNTDVPRVKVRDIEYYVGVEIVSRKKDRVDAA